MVLINRVITRGGDKGKTSLGNGHRVAKDDQRVVAFGTVDEANAAIGVLRLHANGQDDEMLMRIQNDLFDAGADLCVPGEVPDRQRLTEAPSLRLEAEVAEMNAGMPEVRSFILPGGSAGAAYAHVARTLVRRAEREVVALSHSATVNPELIKFLNRLSDHLFVLSRRMNGNGAQDVLWVPGKNR